MKLFTAVKVWGSVLAPALIVVVAKLPTLNNDILFVDEPLYLAQAQRLDSFYAFLYAFEYRVETKFPLGILPHILALLISQPNAILILHLFGLAAVLLSAYLLVNISTLAFGSVVPGYFALFSWVFFLNEDLSTAAIDLEYFQIPLVLLGIWFFVKRAQATSTGDLYLLLAGLSIGLATMVKPPALLVTAVMVGLILLGWGEPECRRLTRSFRRLPSLLVGVATPIFCFAFPYVLNPEAFSELRFNLIELPVAYSGLTSHSIAVRALILLAMLPPAIMVLIVSTVVQYAIRSAFQWRLKKQTANHETLVLAVAIALFVGYVVGQAKQHYWVAVLPFCMLFAGQRLYILLRALQHRTIRILLIAILSSGVIFTAVHALTFYISVLTSHDKLYAEQVPDVDMKLLGNYIRGRTEPYESIWVYYATPEVYWLSGRRPATDEPTSSWLTQSYSQYWIDRTYAELQRDAPSLIIGINHPRYAQNVPGLEELPRIRDFLAEGYDCRNTEVANTTICSRKQ